MSAPEFMRIVWRRLLLSSLVAAVLVWVGSEAFFRVQAGSADRGPRQVELIIPAGTAEKVALGEPVPSIPESMVFVTGDLLVVRNRDAVDHQLGPLWIPAQSSAVLALEQEQQVLTACSFQPNKYFGLDVRPATTWQTRLQALYLAGPSTAIFLALYSFLVFPVKPKERVVKAGPGLAGKGEAFTQEKPTRGT